MRIYDNQYGGFIDEPIHWPGHRFGWKPRIVRVGEVRPDPPPIKVLNWGMEAYPGMHPVPGEPYFDSQGRQCLWGWSILEELLPICELERAFNGPSKGPGGAKTSE